MLVIYGILFAVMPDKFSLVLKSSGNVLLNIFVPLSLVFILMIFLNLFLKPVQIARLLGRGAGIKGILLPVAAGIISAGSNLYLVSFAQRPDGKRSREFPDCDISIQQGCQAVCIACDDSLFRLGIHSDINSTHSSGVNRYWIFC